MTNKTISAPSLPMSEQYDVLRAPISVGTLQIPNRLAVQPMEGCDGQANGAPGPLTRRRYKRFAKGGAGLIWAEATAIVPEGRANPRQLMLTKETLGDFQAMVQDIKETCLLENGYTPAVILQATHSGRYSKPMGTPAPMIAYHNPIFEKNAPIPDDAIVTDDYLKSLPEFFAKTAALAQEAGFDGVDIKCCHRYLLSELMSAYARKGLYGGSLENRARLLFDAVRAAQGATKGGFIVTTRMNVYDGFPYPYGFGVSKDGGLAEDLREPLQIIDTLHNTCHMPIIDITIGNPYVNPHVNRPFDAGPYQPPEDPAVGVERMCRCVGAVQSAFPKLLVVGSGMSYPKQDSAKLAAGCVSNNICAIAGFGRMAIAYPDFARDILSGRGLDAKQCCVCCSKCSSLMRHGTVSGCVVRDSETYLPYYKQAVLGKE